MIRSLKPLTNRRRRAFTLVELLVGAAISLIIMTVLATAFQIGIDTMRQMRSAGDMADQLRAASDVIRRDLQGNFFLQEEKGSDPDMGQRLSDQRFELLPGAALPQDGPPIGGFVLIASSVAMSEGIDADFLASTPTTNHAMQFTSILSRLNGEQGLFTATCPPAQIINAQGTFNPQTYTSSAAELAYFLAPTGSFTPSFNGAAPLPLFNLCRRQRLVAVTDDDAIGLVTAPTQDSDVISTGAAITGNLTPINTLRSLTLAGNRLPLVVGGVVQNLQLSGNRQGEDILLSNVISFEIKVYWSTPSPTKFITNPRPFPPANNPLTLGKLGAGQVDDPIANNAVAGINSDFPFDTLGTIPMLNPTGVFDTANSLTVPIRIRAIQIRIRMFDPKLQTARQITIVQNL